MSFLIASGHVAVEAKTDRAKDEIRDLISTMGGLGPATQDAARELGQLRTKAGTAATSLGLLGEGAEAAERALIRLHAAAGDISIKAELDDQTGAGMAAVSAAITRLRSESPVRLRIMFDGQTAQIVASATAMRDMRGDAVGAGTALGNLTAQAVAAATALDTLERQAQAAARALRTLRGRAAATAAAMSDLRDATSRASTALNTFSNRARTADDRLTTLSGNSRTLRSDMDELDAALRRAGGSMAGLRGRLGTLSTSSGQASGGTSKLTMAALALAPALIPIAAATSAVVAQLAAGTGATVVFGLAIAGQIKKLSSASDAEQKYTKAVREHGKASKQAAEAEKEYLRQVAAMPPASREAAAAWSVLTDEYKQWSDALADDTMPVVTKSLGLMGAMLPKLSPLVRGTASEFDRLMTVLAGGMETEGFDRFMARFTEFSTTSLARATTAMVRFSQSADTREWGQNISQFMDYARENGPLVGDAFESIAKALAHLVAGAADVGVSALTIADAFADLINAVPTSVISNLVQLYATLKLVTLGIAALSAVTSSGAVARLAAYFAIMRAAGVGTTLRATAASMTGMQKAALGLGVLGVAALGISKLAEKARGAPPDVDKLTTSLKNLAMTGQFTGELKKTFGDLDGLVEKVKKLQTQSREMSEDPTGVHIPVLDDIGEWIAGKADDITKGSESLSALKDDFKALDQAMAGMVSSGNAAQAAKDFEVIKSALKDAGLSNKEINDLFPDVRASFASLKAEQQLAAQGMGVFGQQAMDTKSKLDAQKQSADGLRQSIQALNDVNRAALGGMIGFEASIDAAAKAARENAGSLRMINGELDVNSPKAQAAATALADLGAKTDAATAAAREGGASWERINGIYSRGRGELVKYAQQMGLNRDEANQFADSVLKIPDKAETRIEMHREDAIAGLDAVISKIKATPGSKSVTVGALTDGAIRMLEDVGFRTKKLPNGQVKVTAITGAALSNIKNVQAARDRLASKTITITTRYVVTGSSARTSGGQGSQLKYASGGEVRGYASGGGIQAFPAGGLAVGPGTGTSDSIPALVSNGEWVMKAAAVAKYGTRFMAAINDGRLPRFAKGGLTSKQKAALEKKKQAAAEERQRQAEGKSALRGDVTFSTAGKLAGFKNAEMSRDLGTPDSVGALAGTINTYLGEIKKAFTGKTESALVSKMTSSGKALLDHQKKLESVNKRLEAAKSNFDDLKGKFDSLKSSIASSLISFGNITKIGKYGTSPETLIKQLSADAGRTTQFAGQLEQLKAKGLNAQMIEDIASAGVTGGGMATAQSLLSASPEQIARINELQKQLTTSANKAGTVAADAMYGAGLRAAEGLVKGLTAQQNAIEAAMMKIAKSMEAAIKKALGIKSPSRVMMKLGEHTADGFNLGVASRPSLITAPDKMRIQAPSRAALTTPPVVINLTPTFNSMTLPSASERRAFVRAMVKDINDELRNYQRERSVTR